MRIYLGTFLVALATLATEMTLTRLLNAIASYQLAFFAISTAMLGMTAGAVIVYLKPHWFSEEKLRVSIGKACLGCALVTPVSLILLCLTPLHLELSVMSFLALTLSTAACSAPFYFSGMALAAVLTKSGLPIGKLYGSDLLGASLGCLLVLAGLEILDAPSLFLICGSLAALAAACFLPQSTSGKLHRSCKQIFIGLFFLGLLNSSTFYAIRPFMMNSRVASIHSYLEEKWNSFSRVILYKGSKEALFYWSPSPLAPQGEVFQYNLSIDTRNAFKVLGFASMKDIEHLRYDVTNFVYYLRPKGRVCVIGVGGGRDIQGAILFGHEKIDGIEVNPIFVNLLKGRFKDFTGIAGRPGVTLITGEARSYLSRSHEHYSVIQMTLVDSLATAATGAFSLTENALYTVEAWQIFFNRLTENGIFTVSRWHSKDDLSETGRVASLAAAVLLKSGISDPSRHIAMVSTDRMTSLLMSKREFSEEDLVKIRNTAAELRFDAIVLPGMPSRYPALRKILAAASPQELNFATKKEPLNYVPPTDDTPYFFNMLRLNHMNLAFSSGNVIVRGNLRATIILLGLILSLSLLTGLTILLPLWLRARTEKFSRGNPFKIHWPAIFYFSLIGAGFMFAEMALIQRCSVFLTHPSHALGITLFTIIVSTSFGSLLSDRLSFLWVRLPWAFVFPILTVVALLTLRFTLPIVMSHMVASATFMKASVCIAMIFPLGSLLGFFFPAGMHWAQSSDDSETPWYWALNGAFGVLCSALAVFFGIYFGIAINFYLAAFCYGATIVCLYKLCRSTLVRVDS